MCGNWGQVSRTRSVSLSRASLGEYFGICNKNTGVAKANWNYGKLPVRVHEIIKSDSKGKKKPYSTPTVTKLTPEQAKQFVVERTNCSDQEAADVLESLRREQQQNEEKQNEQRQHDANGEKRKRSA